MTPPRRWAARTFVAALALALTSVAPVGMVEAADDPREVQGRALFAKGEYEAALEVYAQLFAEKVDPVYLRNIGRCNQKLRRPAKAIDAFREYLRRGRRIKPAERQEVEGFIQEMEALQAEMDRRAQADSAARAQADRAQQPPPAPAEPAAESRAAGSEAARKVEAPGSAAATDPAAARESSAERPGPEPAARGQTGRMFLAFLAGSGVGFTSGNGELNPRHRSETAGFAVTQLGHLAPEVGLFVSRRLLLSVQLRLQYVTNATGQHIPGAGCGADDYCAPETLALAAFARLGWLFGEEGLRGFLAIAIGGGNIRHVVLFDADHTCGPASRTQCVDTLGSGPFLIGPSFGFFWELGRTMDLVVAVNTVTGYPKFTVHFDLNLGVAFRL